MSIIHIRSTSYVLILLEYNHVSLEQRILFTLGDIALALYHVLLRVFLQPKHLPRLGGCDVLGTDSPDETHLARPSGEIGRWEPFGKIEQLCT